MAGKNKKSKNKLTIKFLILSLTLFIIFLFGIVATIDKLDFNDLSVYSIPFYTELTTLGWKTYSYQWFSIKYPKNWKVGEQAYQSYNYLPSFGIARATLEPIIPIYTTYKRSFYDGNDILGIDFQISIFQNPTQRTINEWAEKYPWEVTCRVVNMDTGVAKISTKKIIAGSEAQQFTQTSLASPENPCSPGKELLIKTKDKIIRFYMQGTNQDTILFDKIVHTLKLKN